MNTEGDEECTADYGVFGDRVCSCSICKQAPRTPSPQEVKERQRWRAKQERERDVSASFNRHMINLYNRKHP